MRDWLRECTILLAAILGPIAFAPPVRTQETITKEKLDHLRAATVYIRAEGDSSISMGSGFLMAKLKGRGYIVTNSHVVTRAGKIVAKVFVVFHSGSKQKVELQAEVVGNDPGRDLAVLVVRSDDLPALIKSDAPVELIETMPVYIAGFPFGEALATAGKDPSVTISKGAISSIRRNDWDRVVAIQVDGNVNPGNSGGPIVSTDGTLVGIAVAKVKGTQIGLAIPTADLRESILGRITGVEFRKPIPMDLKRKLEIRGTLFDPMRKVERISFLWIPRRQLKSLKEPPKPDAVGTWGKVSSDMKKVGLTASFDSFQGEADIPLTDFASEVVFQIEYTRGDGTVVLTPPGSVHLGFVHNYFPSDRPPDINRGDPAGQIPTALTDFSGMSEEDAFFYQPPGRIISPNRSLVEDLDSEKVPEDESDVLKETLLRIHGPVRSLGWYPDGTRVVLGSSMGRDGYLHIVEVPELIEAKRVLLGARCKWVGMSKVGIIALLESNHLAVIDDSSLIAKHYIPLHNRIREVACSIGSTTAIAFDSPLTKELTFIDLDRGVVVGEIPASVLSKSKKESDFGNSGRLQGLTMSEDGNVLLFGVDREIGIANLEDHSVSGSRTTPAFSRSGISAPVFGRSSKEIIAAGIVDPQKSKEPVAGIVGLNGRGLHIFDSAQLAKSKTAFQAPDPSLMFYDKTTDKIWMVPQGGNSLLVFTRDGKREKSFAFKHTEPVTTFFLAPHGEGLISLSNRARWFDLRGQ